MIILVQKPVRWKFWTFVIILYFSVIFITFQCQHPMYFTRFRSGRIRRVCVPPRFLKELVALTHEVHSALTEVNITHFLIYGSLWGAMRVRGPLPWDDDADLGMIADEHFLSMSQGKFLDVFTRRGLTVINGLPQSSLLKIYRGTTRVDLIIYHNQNGVMQRSGWETFLIPFHYRLHHSFPALLVRTPPPLPTMQFGNFNISVPRGGREIMKSLYRYDWWKDYEPDNECESIRW